MTSYEFERGLVYIAEQIIKTFGKDVGVQGPEQDTIDWVRSKKVMHNLEPTLVNRTAAEQIDDYQMRIYEIVKGVFPDAIGYSAECSEGADGNVKTNFCVHRSPIRLGGEKWTEKN